MTDATTFYASNFKAWQASKLGPKPTAEQLDAVHNLGARPGKQALAIAMALREGGVTGSQIVMATGAPQLNKMRGFITDAFLKRLPAPAGENGHTVYKLAVTPKGTQRIERTLKAAAKQAEAEKADGEAKPAKAKKAASKPRKVKVTADSLPVPSPVEGAAETAPEAAQPQA